MLEIKNLQKKFKKTVVLKDFCFTFEHGVYGLLGPNGAGKTTLMRCLTQVYPIKNGTVFFNGKDAAGDKAYLSKMGYLPQKFGMFKDLTVDQMMQMFCALKEIDGARAKEEIDMALEYVNMTDSRTKKSGALSGGMVRRVGVAQALLGNPDIVIFDEPTAGLDPEERLRFKNVISKIKADKTIIISTHIVEDVEAVCDHVAIMKSQNIAKAGTCEEIEQLASGKVFEVMETDIDKVVGKYEVEKYVETNGQKLVKILSSEPQCFEPVNPNVEDGYICLLKGI